RRRPDQVRVDAVEVAVDAARRRDQAVTGDGRGVRPDAELDPIADPGVAGTADPGDAPVLDPYVGLDDPDRRVDDDGADDDRVELARADRARLGHADAEVLGIAPDRFVAGRLAILVHPDPQ